VQFAPCLFYKYPRIISLSGKTSCSEIIPIISDSGVPSEVTQNDQYCAASSATGFQQQTGLQVR
jgi:hypothetical protein